MGRLFRATGDCAKNLAVSTVKIVKLLGSGSGHRPLFCVLLLCTLLMHVPQDMDRQPAAQPVFFSMLFPHLIPWDMPDEEETHEAAEAVML